MRCGSCAVHAVSCCNRICCTTIVVKLMRIAFACAVQLVGYIQSNLLLDTIIRFGRFLNNGVKLFALYYCYPSCDQ